LQSLGTWNVAEPFPLDDAFSTTYPTSIGRSDPTRTSVMIRRYTTSPTSYVTTPSSGVPFTSQTTTATGQPRSVSSSGKIMANIHTYDATQLSWLLRQRNDVIRIATSRCCAQTTLRCLLAWLSSWVELGRVGVVGVNRLMKTGHLLPAA